MNFWHQIKKPIIALSPMDGVTDAAFRRITAKHGCPDIHFTEFTNVEGLARNAMVMLDDFLYSEIERPIVAQIYGSEPESFYKIAIMVCELGFDGIDINMGCPAKKVAARGCGAGLIRNPPLAKKIIQNVKQGVQDWVNGKNIEDLQLKQRMLKKIHEMNFHRSGQVNVQNRHSIPVSVKTRIGYDSVIIEEWVNHLLEEEPVTISIHGRTLKQMYTGHADWEAIARAAEIIHQTPTLVLGNGDLDSMSTIIEKIKLSGVDGVLVGRSSMGNPWIFSQKEQIKEYFSNQSSQIIPQTNIHPKTETRFKVLMEHARAFEEIKGRKRFSAMRKHFGWYCKGMPKAAELRNRMCQTNNAEQVSDIIEEYQNTMGMS